MGMLEQIKRLVATEKSFFQVRNPLLFFTFCIALLGYELDHAVSNLEQTGLYGLTVAVALALLFSQVVKTVGAITEKTPTHLYDNVELLKDTLNSRLTVNDIAIELEMRKSKRISKIEDPNETTPDLRHGNLDRRAGLSDRRTINTNSPI